MLVAALLAAGICASAPLYDMSGPLCSAARQSVECGCSECMMWDPAARATRYEIIRETVSTGSKYTVGTNQTETLEDGTTTLSTTWCFADDSSFPHDGTSYRYRVRACNASACAADSDPILYVAAPYACFSAGKEVACYVGDTVLRP